MKTLPSGAAVALFLACIGASAQGNTPDPVRGTVAGHVYQNGGDDRAGWAEMVRNEGAYDLRITFSEGIRHAAVANASLEIVDALDRPVFSLAHAGPRTDVQLPPGQYRVMAEADGKSVTAKADLRPGHPAYVRLHWLHEPLLLEGGGS